MSYLQLTIGGKIRGLKFNEGAYITFYNYIDQENFAGTFYYACVFAGLSACAYVKREEFTESFEQVTDWVDEMSVEDKNKVKEVFEATAYWKKLVDDGEKLVEKEKTAAQKKRRSASTTKKD